MPSKNPKEDWKLDSFMGCYRCNNKGIVMYNGGKIGKCPVCKTGVAVVQSLRTKQESTGVLKHTFAKYPDGRRTSCIKCGMAESHRNHW